LACGDERRLTGNGSALEVVLHDYALYKSTFTLLYFCDENVALEKGGCGAARSFNCMASMHLADSRSFIC